MPKGLGILDGTASRSGQNLSSRAFDDAANSPHQSVCRVYQEMRLWPGIQPAIRAAQGFSALHPDNAACRACAWRGAGRARLRRWILFSFSELLKNVFGHLQTFAPVFGRVPRCQGGTNRDLQRRSVDYTSSAVPRLYAKRLKPYAARVWRSFAGPLAGAFHTLEAHNDRECRPEFGADKALEERRKAGRARRQGRAGLRSERRKQALHSMGLELRRVAGTGKKTYIIRQKGSDASPAVHRGAYRRGCKATLHRGRRGMRYDGRARGCRGSPTSDRVRRNRFHLYEALDPIVDCVIVVCMLREA